MISTSASGPPPDPPVTFNLDSMPLSLISYSFQPENVGPQLPYYSDVYSAEDYFHLGQIHHRRLLSGQLLGPVRPKSLSRERLALQLPESVIH
jgi:hypothetical protein